MANNKVIDAARKTIEAAISSVESEFERVSQADSALVSVSQRLEVLRRNEVELVQRINDLTSKAAAARKDAEDAEDKARDIVSRARTEASGITTESKRAAAGVRAKADEEARGIIEQAKADAAALQKHMIEARDHLSKLRTQHKNERDRLDQIKKAAAAFAAG